MEKYICPICGKGYCNPGDLSKCVVECAKNEERKIRKIEEKKEELAKIEKEIYEIYETLKNAINNYNGISENKKFISNLRTNLDISNCFRLNPAETEINIKEKGDNNKKEKEILDSLSSLVNNFYEEANKKSNTNKTYEEIFNGVMKKPKANEYSKKIKKNLDEILKEYEESGFEEFINTLFN